MLDTYGDQTPMASKWTEDLETAKELIAGDEPLTLKQSQRLVLSLIYGVHDRLDAREQQNDDTEKAVNDLKPRMAALEARVNIGIGLTVVAGIAGAIALIAGAG